MRVSDFHFEIPPERIAVRPSDPRSSAKLLVYDRSKQSMRHQHFFDLPQILEPGSILVFNETRVLRARFRGRRSTGGELEGLLLPSHDLGLRAWIKGKVNEGEIFFVDGFGPLRVKSRDARAVELEGDAEDFRRFLRLSGEIPLPPYIVSERERRKLEAQVGEDEVLYQSLLATEGSASETSRFSAAAPTASLHFDEPLMNALSRSHCEILRVGLDIGTATFAPLEDGDISSLQISSERCEIRESEWERILEARREGRKIVAVGTTVLRTLESGARREGPGIFETSLTIKPPFSFQIVDQLITNFHWGRSSLLVLAATFMEAEAGEAPNHLQGHWRSAYEEALRKSYLFYSFGDGMLVL